MRNSYKKVTGKTCSFLNAELWCSSDFKCSFEIRTGDLVAINATHRYHSVDASSVNPKSVQKNQKSLNNLNNRD